VTKDDVKKAVDAYTETVKDRLIKDRYKFFGMFFGGAKNISSLKWANGGDIKEAVDAKMLEILGPKDERDVIVKKVCFVALSFVCFQGMRCLMHLVCTRRQLFLFVFFFVLGFMQPFA